MTTAAAATGSTSADNFSIGLLEKGLVPDVLVRMQIRRLLAQRLRDESRGGVERQSEYRRQLIAQLRSSPLALSTREANEQHYEVPTRFFELSLGKRLKYSSGLWDADCNSCHIGDAHSLLDRSEEAMLALTFERAKLEDGQHILELGCGWGSLTLYMAERLPNATIIAVSNSASQREYIEGRLRQMGNRNVRIITQDMNHFDAKQHTDVPFDRVVSVEMFEHMRNYELLLSRIASWMRPEALLFVHIFTHRIFSYPFETKDSSDWMARHFFTDGMMPSDTLLLNFQRDLQIKDHWLLSGTHYQKTSRAWLNKMDANCDEIMGVFAHTYASQLTGDQRKAETIKWFARWRTFYMACEELWGYKGGSEWGVSHYLFQR